MVDRSLLVVGCLLALICTLSPCAAQTPTIVWDQPLPVFVDDIVVVDLDGGLPEILVSSGGGAPDVVVLNSTGTVVATFSGFTGASRDLCVADIDGDGSLDIVVANSGSAYAVNISSGYFGAPWTHYPQQPYMLVAGDLNGDGAAEVVGSGSGQSHLWVYDTVAGSRTHLSLPTLPHHHQFTWSSIAICDLEFDGTKELVLAPSLDTFPTAIYIVDGPSLSLRQGFPSTVPGENFHSLTVADYDRSHTNKLAGFGGGRLDFLRGDGSLFGTPINLSAYPYTHGRMAVGQLDSESHLEAVVPTAESLWVVRDRFGPNGGILFQSPPGPYDLYRHPVIGDVDGDGVQEIVVISSRVSLNCDPYIHVFEADLTPLPGWPKRLLDYATPGVAPYYVLEEVTLADLNGDNVVDIVVGLVDRVLVWTLYNAPPLPTLTPPEWPQSRGGPDNNADYHRGTIPPASFLRSDANGDGVADVSDGIRILESLFAGLALACPASADVDDSSAVDLADVTTLFAYLFGVSVLPPAAPFPRCGSHPFNASMPCPHYYCP
ncbi:MAG: hypothetical protein AAF581_08855 [Planctomycetota bacterium]